MTGKRKWWSSHNLGAFYTAINDLVSEDAGDKYDGLEEKQEAEEKEKEKQKNKKGGSW